jgi:hypothetical protein
VVEFDALLVQGGPLPLKEKRKGALALLGLLVSAASGQGRGDLEALPRKLTEGLVSPLPPSALQALEKAQRKGTPHPPLRLSSFFLFLFFLLSKNEAQALTFMYDLFF